MLRISQTRIKSLPIYPEDVRTEAMIFRNTEPLKGAASEISFEGSDLAEGIPALSAPPVPAAIIESPPPPTPIAGWETEGGAQPEVLGRD